MSLPTAESHDLDEARVLELIFEEDQTRCEGFGHVCAEEVEYLIICSCKVGSEQLCGKCMGEAREHSSENVRLASGRMGKPVRFASTCGDSVFLEDCEIRPI